MQYDFQSLLSFLPVLVLFSVTLYTLLHVKFHGDIKWGTNTLQCICANNQHTSALTIADQHKYCTSASPSHFRVFHIYIEVSEKIPKKLELTWFFRPFYVIYILNELILNSIYQFNDLCFYFMIIQCHLSEKLQKCMYYKY